MGAEVLYPQNCLRSSFRSSPIATATGVVSRRNPFMANNYFANSNNYNANCRSSPRSDCVLGSGSSSYTVANPNSNTNTNFRHGRKTVDGRKKRDGVGGGGLVVSEVTILKRGRSLDEKISRSLTEKKKNNENKGYSSSNDADGVLSSEGCGDLIVFGAGRLLPDPAIISKQIRVGAAGIYAGSVCSASPSPSSLPLPSFFIKKETCAAAAGPAVNMSATEDLRRLLRLA